MKDQTRNLNPTPEAKIAMIMWGERYSSQNGGSMDFWDGLSEIEKRRCRMSLAGVTENLIPISKIEELIKEMKSQPFVDVRYLEVAKIQKLIDEVNHG